ncbi:peptidyl-prolyl cis-trans isomerase D [Desulfuromusa kysingii]|uniref:Periplasmic chaperone PpiD n=1 Tax=Desulfuromusa kysingii TaxID=37625 RepID=A0A1H4C4I6_9BACT|nr:SurA N-terminal domain-containing protein [Desulfuromusa kysingii]SEA55301.1 peptidyl-prolyl cis-trans isomerase D [Desulfuromusa kysingii]
MLQFVRSKQKSVLIKIAFGIIILSFVIGYTMLTAPSDQRGAQSADIAARINGDEISYEAYQSSYSNLYNLYQNIYQGNFDANLEKQLNLPQQALQQLIEESLLIQQADELNLSVTRDELVKAIAQYDAFKVDGKFNRDRYIEVLSYQRMKPEQFEAMQERQLLTQKVRTQLQAGTTVSEEELQAAFHKENDKVNLNYVWLTPALVESKVKVTADGLKEFFDKNIENFRIPEKVSLRYLQFDPTRYEDDVDVSDDEELQRFYRRNLDQYEVKEQIKAAHILLSVPQDADAETVAKRRELANELLKQLQDGADFTQLAKTQSDDKSNAAQGGDLGTFGRGVMVKEFEDAVFSLRPGQLSGIIQTPFGFHIAKVSDYIEPGVKPFVDVIAEVKAGLKLEKSRQLAYEKAMDAYNINRKTADLDAAATNNDLGIKETGLFAANTPIDGIGNVAEISQAALTLKPGELAKPIQTTQGVFLFMLKERKESHLPELAEVKAIVEQEYRTEQAQTLAKELADKLLEQATTQKSLNQAARDLKLTVEESGEFSRSFGFFIPRIGTSQELAEEAFALTTEKPVAQTVFTINNKYLVASLKNMTIANFDELNNDDRMQLENRLLEEKKGQIVAEKISQLLQQAEIEIMIPDLISSFNDGSIKS